MRLHLYSTALLVIVGELYGEEVPLDSGLRGQNGDITVVTVRRALP